MLGDQGQPSAVIQAASIFDNVGKMAAFLFLALFVAARPSSLPFRDVALCVCSALWAGRGVGTTLIGDTRQTDGRPERVFTRMWELANNGTPPASATTHSRDATWGPDVA